MHGARGLGLTARSAVVARSGSRAFRLPRFARGLVGIVAFAAAFELAARLGGFDAKYVPPASAVLIEAARAVLTQAFWLNLAATLVAWALGLALSIAVAVPLGTGLGTWARAYRASRLVVEFMRPIPAVALIPPAILIFGQGLQMKAALAVWAAVWPILFNTIYGMHTVDPVSIDTARAYGFHPAAILWKIMLPHTAPFIATGIRISAAIALVVVIAAEFLAGGAYGLGSWLLHWSQDPESFVMVWAGTLLLGVLGIALTFSLKKLEHELLPWCAARERGAA